jgi:hypothetical protein
MIEQLRGRNLAHVGCTLGLTLGLTLGILLGLTVSLVVRTDTALTLATVAFFACTFGIGALGYYLGGRASRRIEHGSQGVADAQAPDDPQPLARASEDGD